ncbi:MAG: TonB-dependent receptor, partial [Flavobacteriales bacterium]|nr:TonB-dependent receptor [Flavobacteriales bacterium]
VWTLLAGARLDHHDSHGWIFAPRLNVKHNLNEFTALRLNVGNGFRVVNLFTEDHAALTGSRQVLIAEDLRPEESWNINLNFNQVYSTRRMGYGTFDLDVFHTWFANKIVPDYEVDPNLIVYANLSGNGISRGFAFNINHTFNKQWDILTGMTFLDVYETLEEDAQLVREPQPLSPNWSGNTKVTWNSPNKNWNVNYVASITGPMNLPTYEGEFAREEVSPVFSLHHLRVQRVGEFDLFAGVKNIFNYTQDSPLIDPLNPFGSNFDTSYAYGPLQTRRFVLGFNWTLGQTEKK